MNAEMTAIWREVRARVNDRLVRSVVYRIISPPEVPSLGLWRTDYLNRVILEVTALATSADFFEGHLGLIRRLYPGNLHNHDALARTTCMLALFAVVVGKVDHDGITRTTATILAE